MGKRRRVGVEGGGTTFVVALSEDGDDWSHVEERFEIPTTSAEETLQKVKEILDQLYPFDALGISCFGPLELNETKEKYGYITTTPKLQWKDTNILGILAGKDTKWADVPIGFDTDVNAPAMAEFAYHNNTNKNNEKKEEEKIESCAYITVGTGIGVGLVINSKPVHGLLHPEAGHISNTPDKWQFPPPTNTEKSKVDDNENIAYDHFEGTCPFHGSACVEGMASSVALAKRANCTLAELKLLSDDDIIWEKCAHHLGGLCATLLLVASPEKIMLSGGVMRRTVLFPKIREKVYELLGGYIGVDRVQSKKGLEKLIGPSRWGDTAGIIGSLYLAEMAYLQR
ncbi:unnamed protein product [Bathycoccus prasinos]